MNKQTPSNAVLLAGATGLIGGQCLRLLCELADGPPVIALSRRPLPNAPARMTQLVTDFGALFQKEAPTARVALCALGTTMKQAGSKAAFRAVDYDAVLAFGQFAVRAGVEVFGLVSSVGADPSAANFYLRVKGETEAALEALGFRTLVALRPSLLLGARDESRPAEAASQALAPILSPLLQGSMRRFRAIRAEQVAAALVSLAVHTPPAGRHVWHYDDILAAGATRGGPGRAES